jgi:hypothetical protein
MAARSCWEWIGPAAALVISLACGGGESSREAGAGDGSGARLPTGSACAGPSDCESFCLTNVVFYGQMKTFAGGYCTRKCQLDADCGGVDICTPFTDAAGHEVARYCLAACPPAVCRSSSGYVCTSGSVCLPK